MLMAHISWHFTKFYQISIFNAVREYFRNWEHFWQPATLAVMKTSSNWTFSIVQMTQHYRFINDSVLSVTNMLRLFFVVVGGNWALKCARVMWNVTLGFKHYGTFENFWKLQEVFWVEISTWVQLWWQNIWEIHFT